MGKIAFIFPGQGSQFVSMGSDLYDEFDSVKTLYQSASNILGFDLAKVSFHGPEDELRQTHVTQPALFVHSCAVLGCLREMDIEPEMTAGHSLGEYSALMAAGVFSFEEGLSLVKLRGELMQKAGQGNSGAMAAIIGLDFNTIEKLCEQARQSGVIQPANFNSSQQVVISGSVDGVKEAMALAQLAGAKRVVQLNVSGAFHSPLMSSAKKQLRNALEQSNLQNARIPVYCNVNAKPTMEAADIRELLADQLTNPVLWYESAKNMIADGATEFLEVGAGKVLTGLLRRIDKNVTGKPVGTLAALKQFELNERS